MVSKEIFLVGSQANYPSIENVRLLTNDLILIE